MGKWNPANCFLVAKGLCKRLVSKTKKESREAPVVDLSIYDGKELKKFFCNNKPIKKDVHIAGQENGKHKVYLNGVPCLLSWVPSDGEDSWYLKDRAKRGNGL